MGNLLRFDLTNFLTAPFINLHNDTTGRQLFFNYWLKSAIFGEFQFPGGLLTLYTAAFAAASLLMLLLPLAVGYLKALRDPRLMVFAIDLTIWFISAWLYRFNFAYAPSSDFRYSYPAIISATILITEGCRHSSNSQILQHDLSAAFILQRVLASYYQAVGR